MICKSQSGVAGCGDNVANVVIIRECRSRIGTPKKIMAVSHLHQRKAVGWLLEMVFGIHIGVY
jgi:hypothetical protein